MTSIPPRASISVLYTMSSTVTSKRSASCSAVKMGFPSGVKCVGTGNRPFR
jgi:hypothetical protein